ncbi:MAG: hypothetical protein ABFR33_04055 [Verrucomicrobiota bacterium]
MRKTSMIIIVAIMAAAGAHAKLVEFEDYVLGGITGQDGWIGSHATVPLIYGGNNITNVFDSYGNELQVAPYRWCERDFSSDVDEITTVSMLVSGTGSNILGNVYLKVGTNDTQILWYQIDTRDTHDRIYANDGYIVTSGVEVEDLKLDAVLNFTAQDIDITVTRLSDMSVLYSGTKAFQNPATLADARESAVLRLYTVGGGSGSETHINYDNVRVGNYTPVQIDFESPPYTASSSSVNGQNGWAVYSGEASVYSNAPSVLGSGNQELGALAGCYVYKHFSGADFTSDPTCTFKVGRTADMTADVRLGAGTGTANAIAHLYLHFTSGINAYDGGSLTNVFSEFDTNDVYEITVDVDFGTSTYDVTASNLTDGTSGSFAGLGFENAKTSSDFTNNISLRINPFYETLWVDDVNVNGYSDNFEEPAFKTLVSFSNIEGQASWVVTAGSAYVYSNSPAILGGGDQELGLLSGALAYRNISGNNLDTNMTCQFKVGRTADMTGQMRLGAGGADNAAIIHIDFDSASGIGVYDGGTGNYVNVWSEFDSNDVYQVKTEIDFATQTYDITIDNLTDATSASLNTVDFEHAKTLGDFTDSLATLRFDAQTHSLWVDDILLYGPLSLVDSDGDGLPDTWELGYYSHITDNVTSNDIVANAVNTALQAYIAGFDPTDSGAFFIITDISDSAGNPVIQWNQAVGRQYDIYWSPNLTLGFAPLHPDFVGGSYTDTVNGANSEGFYKIDVEVAP